MIRTFPNSESISSNVIDANPGGLELGTSQGRYLPLVSGKYHRARHHSQRILGPAHRLVHVLVRE